MRSTDKVGPYSRVETDEEFRARLPESARWYEKERLDEWAWDNHKKQRKIIWVTP